MSGWCWAAPLWCVNVACLQVLGACTTDVAIFSLRGDGAAGAAEAEAVAAASSSNSTNILITKAAQAATTDASCQPGHYVGVFNGTYNSAAWGNGSVPLSIAATPSMGRPGLEFWLERIPNDCHDAEFCADFTVKGGKIRGFANPFSDPNAPAGDSDENLLVLAVRFEIDFGGELDCSRGQFRGLLQNGCYDVATILFRFEGTAPGNYDSASSSFSDGQWIVKELPSANTLFPPDANIGGMGNWQASLANDNVAPAAQSGGLCDM
jgi:hypothetical protein